MANETHIPHPDRTASPVVDGASTGGDMCDETAGGKASDMAEFVENASVLKARGAYEQRQRERRSFLSGLGIEDPVLFDLFGKMEQLDFDMSYVFQVADMAEQESRLSSIVERRLNGTPSYAFTNFRSRRRLGSRVSGASQLKEDLDCDLETLERTLVLSSEIMARLEAMLADRRVRHEQLARHYGVLREKHRTAQEALPSWGAAFIRSLEGTGLPRDALRSKAGVIWAGFVDVVRAQLGDEAVTTPAFQRELTRFVDIVDGGASDRAGIAAPLDRDRAGADASTSASPGNGMGAGTGAWQGGNGAASGASPLPAGSVSGTAADPFAGLGSAEVRSFTAASTKSWMTEHQPPGAPRVAGHSRVEGLPADQAGREYMGYFSQFDPDEPLAASAGEASGIVRRMERREMIDPLALKPGEDGALPDLAWQRFEVPLGGYILLQITAMSPVLPRFRPGVMLPPFVALRRYGELVGGSDRELKDLAR